MTEREIELEEILYTLLTKHFYKRELFYGYSDVVSIFEQDIELYLKICKELPQVILENSGD